MLQVQNLSKSYGDIQALQSATFAVSPGEIVGLLGPNGAGKSTTIKIVTGYLHPDEGSVNVDGLDVVDETQKTQAVVGYLPENAPLYPELSVQRYLQLVAELRQIPDDERLGCLSDAIHAVGLQDRLTQPIGTLSKGFRQRVGLAQAILHRPKLLILDEPSIGLDPTQIVEMRRLIRRLSETSTVLFSTHILSEVEALCDRVVILMNGQVRLDCGLDELESTPSATIVFGKETDGVQHVLATTPWIRHYDRVVTGGDQIAYSVTGKESVATDLCPRLYSLATSHEWPLWELRRDTRTLEDVFNELATSEVAEPDAAQTGVER